MKKWTVIVLGLLISPIYAQTVQTINIRGVTVNLGMTRAQILSKFNEYRIVCTGAAATEKSLERCDSMFMTSTSSPFQPYGSFGFKNDRLSFANKYWSDVYSGGSPEQFAQALYDILRQDIGSTQSATYTVTVWDNADPSGNMKNIKLTSGRKSVEISIGEKIRGSNGNIIPTFVNLDEVIRQ